MEQISKIFSRLCDNKNNGKDNIRTYIKGLQQTMFVAMVDTPGLIKERHINSHSLVLVKQSAV